MSSPVSPTATIDRARLKKISATVKSHLPSFRILLVGAKGVGKTALAVRFVTKRFIGEYDSSAERIYQRTDSTHGPPVQFMILDTIDHMEKTDVDLKDQINWADSFIVMYSVTDDCSFREVDRLKFLINHLRKSKSSEKLSFFDPSSSHNASPVVFLVGNKQDVFGERMVTYEQGEHRCRASAFAAFYEISVRESVSGPQRLFFDLYADWMEQKKQKPSKLGRANSTLGSSSPSSLLRSLQFKRSSLADEKSRSPSPDSRASRSSDGTASSQNFRIQVHQTTTSFPSRRLGDDLWTSKFDSIIGANEGFFEESLSIPVPNFMENNQRNKFG